MAARNVNLQKNSTTRVFLIDGGAAPNRAPTYEGVARITGVDWSQGDVTPIRIPDPDSYDGFIDVDTLQGEPGLPTATLEARLQQGRSRLLEMVRRKCTVGLQVHSGLCKNPTDFNGGWSDGKVWVFDASKITNYSTGELGAIEPSQRNFPMETLAITAKDFYEIVPLVPGLLAGSIITDEVVDVLVADAITCGSCGLPSDGCQVAFALVKDSSGSPGISSSVVYTSDGWTTVGKSIITTLGLAENPTAMAAVGEYLVITSNNGLSHSYVLIRDLVAGTGVWSEVTSGYVSSKGPNAIVSVSPSETYIVGDGGYIYSMTDPTAAVTVLTAGSETIQNLARIAALGSNVLVAVGASNVVLVSRNGGVTWGLITGPAAGVALTAVTVVDDNRWFVGTAGGNLYYTLNGGTTWTVKAFQGSGAGSIGDVLFATEAVGYLTHAASSVGYLLRTIDGGHSWYRMPEQTGVTLPANQRLNRLATCGGTANMILAGGLGNDGNDGVLIRAN